MSPLLKTSLFLQSFYSLKNRNFVVYVCVGIQVCVLVKREDTAKRLSIKVTPGTTSMETTFSSVLSLRLPEDGSERKTFWYLRRTGRWLMHCSKDVGGALSVARVCCPAKAHPVITMVPNKADESDSDMCGGDEEWIGWREKKEEWKI